MMPAVGNVPERSGPGVSASGTRMGASSVNNGDGSGSGNEFGSAMTTAFANQNQQHAPVSERQTVSGHPAAGQEASKTQTPKSGTVSAASAVGSAAQGAASSQSQGAAAGKQAAGNTLPDGQSKSEVASTTAAVSSGDGDGDAGTGGLAAPGDPTGQPIVAGNGDTEGAQALDAAAQSSVSAVSVEQTPEANATPDAQRKASATAGGGTKENSKKTDASSSGAVQTALLPIATAGVVAVAAAPAPAPQGAVPAVKAASSHGGTKGDGGATAASAGRIATTAGMIAVALAAVPGASSGTNAGKHPTVAPGGNSGSAGKVAAVQGAVQGAVAGAGTGIAANVGVRPDANPDANPNANLNANLGQVAGTGAISANGGTGSATTPSSEVQSTGVQSAIGMTASQAQRVATGAGTTGTGASGNAVSNGFTATLLSGQPALATAAAQPVAHAAVGASGTPGSVNPYARMDDTHGATLVYASPQKMSVAISDPSLGSFQVRAQSAGAQIAASLATTSATTHAQLSGQLPSLTAFLQEQRVDLGRVTVMQQSMLGGDSGPRDSGRQQQGRSGSSDSSRSWGARARRVGTIGATESVGSASDVGGISETAGRNVGDGVAVGIAGKSTGSGQQVVGSGVISVDVLV